MIRDLDPRSIVVGAVITASLVAGTIALGTVMGAGAWSERGVDKHTTPASEVRSAEAGVYDRAAGMCAIDLVVDVAPGDRVVIENELTVGNGRTVENAGQRYLTAVVPAESRVLIYAVNLEANASKTLETYRVTDECTLREASDR